MPMTGDNLRQWRKAKKLKQQTLAELIGVDRRTLQGFESGEYPIKVTYELAIAALSLGITGYDGVSPIEVTGQARLDEILATTAVRVRLTVTPDEPAVPPA